MVPYTSGFGVDCSGLVQLSMRMAGRAVLREDPAGFYPRMTFATRDRYLD